MPAKIFKLANPQITLSKYGSKLLTLSNILTFGFCFKKNLSIFDISPIIWNSILGYILRIKGKILFANSKHAFLFGTYLILPIKIIL